jgi:hypothetical protein
MKLSAVFYYKTKRNEMLCGIEKIEKITKARKQKKD